MVQPCMLFWPWCQSVWISSSAIVERHLSDIILFDWHVTEGRKRASAIYNACSVALVAVAALVAADWPLQDGCAIPAAAVIACVLGKRKSSGVLPGSAPVMVLQAIMLVLYYSNLVTRSAALLPLPALLVYPVAAWTSARRMTPVATGVGSLMALILFGLLPLVTEIRDTWRLSSVCRSSLPVCLCPTRTLLPRLSTAWWLDVSTCFACGVSRHQPRHSSVHILRLLSTVITLPPGSPQSHACCQRRICYLDDRWRCWQEQHVPLLR
jgi:hypothetical protein